MTYKEIGKLFGISKQRVQQIQVGYKSKSKSVEDLKIWNKRKRKYLGLPLDVRSNKGGLDFIRDIVRKRDSDICQKCLKKWIKGKRKLDVHHLDIKMEGTRDLKYDRENLDKMITLCHRCHLNLHTVREKMRNAYK